MRGIKSYFSTKKRRSWKWLRSKQTLLFGVFLALSAMLWMLQILQDTYVTHVRVPVVMLNFPSDLSIVGEVPEYIEVEVRDNGFALLNYSLANATQPIALSFDLDKSREGEVEWNSERIENELFKRFGANGRRATITSFSPRQISFSYAPKAKREVPITFQAQLIASPGVVIQSLSFSPDKVIVYGNKSALDTLEVIRTDTITYFNLEKSQVLKVPLVAPEGVTLTPTHLSVDVAIEPLVQRTFTLPISVEESQKFTLRLFPARVQVVCVVPKSRERELSADDIKVELDAEDEKALSAGRLRLKITTYPDYVQMIQCEPEEVEFILEEK